MTTEPIETPSPGRLRSGLLILLLFLAAVPAMAQSGGLRVTVFDETGELLPGATVSLTSNQQLVPPQSLVSDAAGQAVFPILRAGTGYIVEVHLPGFAAQRVSDLRVRSNATKDVVVTLGTSVEERVEVLGTRDVVDIEQVGNSTKFSEEFIEGLPTPGRFYQDFLTLAPGVNDDDGDGNPNVHGARSRDFRVEVSGVSNVDPLTGQWLSRVNPDSIEEMEVITSGAGAEFGRAQGGFARVIQKQGTNEFEGVFNFLYRSSKLDGDGAGGSSAVAPAPEFETIQPSFQISGPIVKDKLWFRASHEWIDREDPVNLLNRVDLSRREQTINSDQITWQVSPRNKLALQYQSDPLLLTNLGIGTTVPSESSRQLETSGPTWALNWTAPYSARMLIDSQVAWQDISQDLIPMEEGVAQDCLGFDTILPLSFSRCTNLETTRVSGSHFEASRDKRQRLTVRTQMTLHRSLAGQSHQIKLGFRAESERYFRDLDRGTDISFSITENPFGDPEGLASVRIAVPQVSSARATGNSWGIFVEDQWKPLGNLAVTLGLRLDREEIDSFGSSPFSPEDEAAAFNERIDNGSNPVQAIPPSFTAYESVGDFIDELAQIMDLPSTRVSLDSLTRQSAFWPASRRKENIETRNTNVAPRFSIAWDPTHDGRTKIAASAGRYYDKIFLAIPLVELEPIETTLNMTALFRPQGFVNFDTGVVTSPLTARVVDRDLSTPFSDEYTLSVEREVARESSVRVSYIRRKFQDQLQDIDINHLEGDQGSCILPSPLDGRVVQISEGSGQTITDPYTGEQYVDTDPGRGDGRIDDCTGDVISTGGILGIQTDQPDGLPDLYVQNPGWREILLLGNFNTADYRSVVAEFIRRSYRNWEMQASYTWSRAVGDAEDFDLSLGNEQNLRDDERGYLDYDQRHVVRLNATRFLSRGFRVGTVIRWDSGLPYSIISGRQTVFSTPPLYFNQGPRELRTRFRFPTGQRNDQRNEAYWTFDALLAKEFALGRHGMFQLTAEVFNLFNDSSLRLEEQINGVNTGERRFGRQWQLGFRYAF